MIHQATVPEWAAERGRNMNFFPSPDPCRTALIVIDMQRYFMAEGQPLANPYARGIVPNINRIVAAMRKAGVPVYWIRHTNARSGPQALPAWKREMPLVAMGYDRLLPGAPGHDVDPSLDRLPGDPVIDKFRYSCFIQHSSDLHDRLQAVGIDTIIIVGTLTNGCCECTVRDASMIGYKVLGVADAMAAVTDEEQAAALLGMRIGFADIVTTEEIIDRMTQDEAARS